jgi:hypothetical protein
MVECLILLMALRAGQILLIGQAIVGGAEKNSCVRRGDIVGKKLKSEVKVEVEV